MERDKIQRLGSAALQPEYRVRFFRKKLLIYNASDYHVGNLKFPTRMIANAESAKAFLEDEIAHRLRVVEVEGARCAFKLKKLK